MTPSKAPLPFLGTWRLTKVETSRPDLPHPQSGVTTFTQENDIIQYTNDGVWTDGRRTKVTAVLQLDGSLCPITNSMVADALTLRVLDDGTLEVKMKRGGVDVGTNQTSVSPDGRTMTGQWDLVGPGGTKITWNTTQERQ